MARPSVSISTSISYAGSPATNHSGDASFGEVPLPFRTRVPSAIR